MKITFLFKAFLLLSLLTPVSSLAWECDVTVSGPNTVKLDQQITLSALGTPAGGSYSWSRTPNLIPNGATATLTGFQPTYSEYIKVIGYYTSPKGRKCSDAIWLWACVCTVTSLKGPAEAKIGEQVTLTAQADPTGGTYTWTVNSGTGTLIPSDSSAVFIGDKAGPVEIKVSYVPPDGGEPCEKYHTIQLNSDCKVTLTGYELQRPVCRAADFTAQGIPAGGICKWTAGNGISGTDCNAIYTTQTVGNDTVTVTYTTPGGTTCNDSKNVLSYSLDGMVSKKKCFGSGTVLQRSDFDFFTSPASFSFGPILSPETVTTNQSQAQVLVTASPVCDSGYTNEASTVINVVNKDNKTTSGVKFEIPNLLTGPLEKLGLVDKLKFELQNNYNLFTECCSDGPIDSTSGETALRVVASSEGLTLIGVPLPPAFKKYVTLDLFQTKLSGRGDIKIMGESKACEATEIWSGGGSVSVGLEMNAVAKVTDPKKYLLIEGKIGGGTDISQTLTVYSTQLDASGKWGGLTVAGKIIVQTFGFDAPEFFVSHTVISGKATPPFSIEMPSLK